jgi:hypothetical protein
MKNNFYAKITPKILVGATDPDFSIFSNFIIFSFFNFWRNLGVILA